MALVKYGGGIQAMSGSIGGQTHARNRSGFYIRAKTKPINPNTAPQNLVRSVLAELTTRWAQTLTDAQRIAWNLYASSVSMKNKLGDDINLTGFNHYIRSNANLRRRGETIVDAGPTIFELPEKDPTMSVVASATWPFFTLTFDDTMDWVDEDGAWLWIAEGSPQNAQRNYFGGPYLGLKDKHGDSVTPITSPETFSSQHVLSEGQRVWLKFRITRADGRISEPWTINTVVVA